MNTTATEPSRRLRSLLGAGVDVPVDVAVTDITLDSRQVTPGAAFFACRGQGHHGLEYAQSAVARGARAIIWESDPQVTPPSLDSSVVVHEVPRLHSKLGEIADRFFAAPSAHLEIAGITGTNGKTTCVWLLAQALGLLGRRAAYIGTLGVGSPSTPGLLAAQPLEHTTPDVLSVHRWLAELRAQGMDSVAMEVSSHALAQDRCAAVRFATAAFTNLTRDHLDYHPDMVAYGAAKAKLLEWPGLKSRVINVDDGFGATLAQRWLPDTASVPKARCARLFLTSRQEVPRHLAAHPDGVEFVHAARANMTPDGVMLTLATSDGAATLSSTLRGHFNVDNLLTVLGVLLAWEVPLQLACATLERCQPPPGRMEPCGGGTVPLVLIDYAHTPDALAQALAAARLHCQGRLWCVFGCGGERDRGKRAEMGRIAAAAADELIITDDNPRGEDPSAIVAAILQGVREAGAQATVIHDRGEAIRAAVSRALVPDVVLIAGKGHEDYQLVGAERRAFSDRVWVRNLLAVRNAT